MEDLIRRLDAIDALGEEPEVWEDDDEYGMGMRAEWCRIKKIIEKLPSAQPKRKMGEWIKLCGGKVGQCSNCKKEYDRTFEYVDGWMYCPSCGADMTWKEKE